MKRQTGANEPKGLSQRKSKQRVNNAYNTKNISNNNIDEYRFESYENMQKTGTNTPFEDIYLGSGEMEDQIQSYKEQLIDAKLKNIKLTNEVQKLKELSKTQNKFYSGLNNPEENQDLPNQTDSMFYKSNSMVNINQQMKIIEDKYEKKLKKYHDKIKALKGDNSKKI